MDTCRPYWILDYEKNDYGDYNDDEEDEQSSEEKERSSEDSKGGEGEKEDSSYLRVPEEDLYFAHTPSMKCLKKCPSPLFANKSSYSCVGKCKEIGYYPNETTRRCESCFKSCKKCIGSGEFQCTECKDNYGFYQNSCVSRCPGLLFMDPIARQCVSRCPEKTIGNIVTKICGKQHCQVEGFYFDEETRLCQKCHPDCKICFNKLKTGCLICNNNNLLFATYNDFYTNLLIRKAYIALLSAYEPNLYDALTSYLPKNIELACRRTCPD